MYPTPESNPSENLKINMGIGPAEGLERPVYIGDQAINEDYLVVYVDISINTAFAINLDTVARFPIQLKYQDLLSQIDRKQIVLFEMDWPKEVLVELNEAPQWRQDRANERYEVIRPLLHDLESVLRNNYGQKCFQEVIDQSGRAKQWVYDCFYGFLRMGQRVLGLSFSIGKNTVHIPKARELRVKQGRVNKYIAKGKVLDEYDFRVFQAAKNKLNRTGGPSIKHIYDELLRGHYVKSRKKNDVLIAEKTGERFKVELLPPDERPTYNQFYYWLVMQFEGNIPMLHKNRQNKIENKKDNAGRSGDAYMHVIGPGQVFELDETPFIEELVSVFDPTRSTHIGKATLYFVVDVFSKLIAGLFITTENPSYNTVKQAIFNAARDKQQWFDELGFNFDAKYWPQSGVPSTIFVDKAEFHNKISEGPVADLPVVIKFARTARGDDKPNVEQLFHVFQTHMEDSSKASQTKSMQDIATQIARKHACLTVPELYQIAIVYTLYYNNNRLLKSYAKEREMVRDKVPTIPAKLWDWGRKNRPGCLKSIPEGELYLKLLAKGTVTVHRHGLYLKDKGLWYNCEWTLATGLQERKLPSQRSLVLPCRYNAELVDIILICTNDGLKIATLDHKENRFAGLSFYQVAQQKKSESKEQAFAAEEEIQYLLGVDAFIKHKLTIAKKEKVTGPIPNISKIKDNRKLEALINRQADMHRYLQSVQSVVLDSVPLQEDESEQEYHKGHNAFYKDA